MRHYGTLLLLICLCLPLGALAQESDEMVILRLSDDFATSLIDPVYVVSSSNVDAVVNQYLGLVINDPANPQEILPALAESWEISDDGLVYTFFLRGDVPWVEYDRESKTFTPLRYVRAQDVVYSIRRACSNWQHGYYAVDVIGPIIEGCNKALDGGDPNEVGVSVVDDLTVEIRLTTPGSYFLAMSTLWTISPVPRELVEQGENWFRSPKMIFNGPYVLEDSNGSRASFLRNPYFPEELWGGGNADRVYIYNLSASESFSQFQNQIIDRSYSVSRDFRLSEPDNLYTMPTTLTFYFGLSNDKAPLDNVHLRRALGAVMARDAYVNDYLEGNGLPIFHFAPPALFGGFGRTSLGVGYNVDYAREQLAEAGYPNCQGLPVLEVASNIASFVESQITQLGCTGKVQSWTGDVTVAIEPNNFVPVAGRPHIWSYGWGADYGDADNYMELLSCGVYNSYRKSCTETDEMILRARVSPDPDERLRLYEDILLAFFGQEGEFPMIPLAEAVDFRAAHPWLSGPHSTNGAVGGERYDYYRIDAAAQPNPAPEFWSDYTIKPLDEIDADAIISPDLERPTSQLPPPPVVSPAITSTLAPVIVEEAPVTQQTRPSSTCSLLYIGEPQVYVRRDPSTANPPLRLLEQGKSYAALAQSQDSEGFTWWQLDLGEWVRGDVVVTSGSCHRLPLLP